MQLDNEQRALLADTFLTHVEYLETRISLLNRRACLYKDKPCGMRARNVITGMVDVINALGFEVVGDWAAYHSEFAIVPTVLVADAPGH
jgi:hypothetical protein